MISALGHVLDLENLVQVLQNLDQDLPSPVLHPDPYQGQDPDPDQDRNPNRNPCPDLGLDPDQALAQVLDQKNPDL